MDIKCLEQFGNKVDILLENFISIKQENLQLKETLARLLLENRKLHKKQIHLGERIESIVRYLKENTQLMIS